MSEPKGVTIARIPTGQPLELSSALFGFFGAALDHCLASEGDGFGNAAEVIGGEGVTVQQVVTQLRRATTRLRRGRKTAESEPPVDEPVDELAPDDSLTLNAMRSTPDGAVEFGIGGGGDMARDMATHLLAAFIPAFEEHPDAVNYLSWDATVPETGKRYSLIVVRPDGLTPHEARQRADQEAERLRALLVEHGNALRAVRELCDRWAERGPGSVRDHAGQDIRAAIARELSIDPDATTTKDA